MAEYPLKTLQQLYAERPKVPSSSDIIPVGQGVSVGAYQLADLLVFLADNLPLTDAAQAAIAAVVGAAPGQLDTIDELAAALGDDANYAATVTAALANKQPLDAQLTALAGLTGAAGRFVRWTGASTAVMQAIVGTVSQSGGVPTGALIERGSNANGEYARFADGTQICTMEKTGVNITTAFGSALYRSDIIDMTFPAAFAVTPMSVVSGDSAIVFGAALANSGTAGQGSLFYVTNTLTGRTMRALAVGRWF